MEEIVTSIDFTIQLNIKNGEFYFKSSTGQQYIYTPRV